jgi:hypothetical protein
MTTHSSNSSIYCDYLNPSNGKPCNHFKLYKSNFCHKKTHHPDPILYKGTIQSVRNHFQSISSPIPSIEHIQFYNPPMNGACLYSCFVKYLMNHISVYENAENPFHDLIHCYISNLGTDADFSLEQFNTNVYRMQILLKDYICEHRDDYIIDGITWSFLIEECHQMSIRDYDMYYNISASEENRINKRPIPSRWGSMAELLAFSKIFGIPIRIYKTIRINAKYQIVECFPHFDDMRLQFVQDVHVAIDQDSENQKSPTIEINEWSSDRTIHLIHVQNHYSLVYGHIV